MSSRFVAALGAGLLFCLAAASSYVLLPRLGIEKFVFTIMGVTIGFLYLVVSFKYLTLPYYLTILSIGGFRFLWSVKAPMLPDLYLDRMMLILMMLVFAVKFFAEGRRLKGPFALDLLILAHATYLFVTVMVQGFINFNAFSRSILVPYLMYFFAKNIFQNKRQVQILFAILLCLGLYYSITSIAEKFNIYSLLYPADLRLPETHFIGRSIGPFGNPGVFGVTMGLILPLNLYFLSLTKNGILKILLIVSMGLGMLGLFFTYTRGPWVSSILGMITVVWFNRKHYLKFFLPLLVVAPIIGSVFLGLGNDKFMKERVENEDTIGSRLGTGVTALRVWRDHPFLGCGFFRFGIVREKYIQPVNIPGFETIRFVQFRKNSLHDMYWGILAEDGLIGFGMLVGIYFLVLRLYIRVYRRRKLGDHFATFIIPLFMGVMVTYLVGGLFFSYRYFSTMSSIFLMTAGIANGYDPESYQAISSKPEQP